MNPLELRNEFEAVLKDYQPSKDVIKLLALIRLLLLVGPSAVGRNTIISKLNQTGRYHFIVSDTTRRPRINNGVQEIDGQVYWFRSEADFLRDLKRGEFLEAEIIHNRQVSGISVRELKRAQAAAKIAVDDIDIGGFKNILKRKPDTVGIFVLPPSFGVWLNRLHGRGQMNRDELTSRLHTGISIFSEVLKNTGSWIIVNDILDNTVKQVDDLVNGQFEPNMNQGLQVAADLLKSTRDYLSKNGQSEL